LKAWGGVLYYKTSVREEINVAEVFEDVIRQMVKVGVGREDDRRKRRRKKCCLMGVSVVVVCSLFFVVRVWSCDDPLVGGGSGGWDKRPPEGRRKNKG
jgi:hypothetical protein